MFSGTQGTGLSRIYLTNWVHSMLQIRGLPSFLWDSRHPTSVQMKQRSVDSY